MAWTTADQAYELFYKDDDARVSRHDIAAIWVAFFLRCHDIVADRVCSARL